VRKKAGNLKSTSQEKREQSGADHCDRTGQTLRLLRALSMDPWLAYGEPIGIWPGWYSYPGLFLAGPGMRLDLLWNWLFWRVRLGLAPLGIRLASPRCHL